MEKPKTAAAVKKIAALLPLPFFVKREQVEVQLLYALDKPEVRQMLFELCQAVREEYSAAERQGT
jgi:predicted nuclease of restriction endonuclease-like RecB superfamily